MITLSWVKCGNGANWCPLQNVDLSNVITAGVYIIWVEGNPSYVIRVGQGNIAERLEEHRNDNEIVAYARQGTLRVTWAALPEWQRNGVERYLADHWSPRVGDRYPSAEPIAVNSPWG